MIKSPCFWNIKCNPPPPRIQGLRNPGSEEEGVSLIGLGLPLLHGGVPATNQRTGLRSTCQGTSQERCSVREKEERRARGSHHPLGVALWAARLQPAATNEAMTPFLPSPRQLLGVGVQLCVF